MFFILSLQPSPSIGSKSKTLSVPNSTQYTTWGQAKIEIDRLVEAYPNDVFSICALEKLYTGKIEVVSFDA